MCGNFSHTVVLNITHNEALQYKPPRGMSVSWLSFDQHRKLAVAQFFCSDDSFWFEERLDKWHLDHEIYNNPRLRVVYDFETQGQRQPKPTPKTTTDILLDDCVLDLLQRGSKHRVSEKHSVPFSKQYYQQLNNVFKNRIGTDKKPNKDLVVGRLK